MAKRQVSFIFGTSFFITFPVMQSNMRRRPLILLPLSATTCPSANCCRCPFSVAMEAGDSWQEKQWLQKGTHYPGQIPVGEGCVICPALAAAATATALARHSWTWLLLLLLADFLGEMLFWCPGLGPYLSTPSYTAVCTSPVLQNWGCRHCWGTFKKKKKEENYFYLNCFQISLH